MDSASVPHRRLTPTSSSGDEVVCATMHAERLHDDRVWVLVQRFLSDSARPWTVFVEPVHARIAGVDLAPRLAWLAERGHESAMHTHLSQLHGDRERASGFSKGSEPSARAVEDCLDNDFRYLVARGHVPRGFVAGAWRVDDRVLVWLVAHDFVYDCTLRTYMPAGAGSTQ